MLAKNAEYRHMDKRRISAANRRRNKKGIASDLVLVESNTDRTAEQPSLVKLGC